MGNLGSEEWTRKHKEAIIYQKERNTDSWYTGRRTATSC